MGPILRKKDGRKGVRERERRNEVTDCAIREEKGRQDGIIETKH